MHKSCEKIGQAAHKSPQAAFTTFTNSLQNEQRFSKEQYIRKGLTRHMKFLKTVHQYFILNSL